MTRLRDASAYPASYREKEMRRLAAWILAGESGAVVGLSGCGRSNLLHFLGRRPDVLHAYLPPGADPVALIPVDLNHLPVNDSATLYRVLLRAFYWVRHRFQPPLNEAIASFYLADHPFTSTGWQIRGRLLADYISRVGPAVRGKIRFDQKTGEIYQGLTSLQKALTPKEYQLLYFLLQHPYRPHTKSSLINEAWAEDEIYDKGITDVNLHRLAADLRKKIEKDKSQPHYLITCKHVPDETEGGYQLYPEGRPVQNPG